MGSLVVTLQLWTSARTLALQELQSQFDFRVMETANHLRIRMLAYEQVLRGVQGLFAASRMVDREGFRAYTGMLALEDNYPGIQGISFARLLPSQKINGHIARIDGHEGTAGENGFSAPIEYIEPLSGPNRRALGYDLYSEPVRQAAMITARDTGKAAITGKLRLVQESGENGQAGFIMFLPVYGGGFVPTTVEMRRTDIVGWVSAPFRMRDLIAGIIREDTTDLDIRIYDGDVISDRTLLYDNDPGKNPHGDGYFQVTRNLMIVNHAWKLVIRSLPDFNNQIDSRRSQVIAVSGIGIACLLTLITWMLVHGRSKAIETARKIRVASQALQEAEKLALIGHFDYDPRSDTTFWSEGLERIWGFETGAPYRMFKDFLDTIHPEDLHIILASDADKNWRETSTEFRIIRSDGEIRHISSRGYRELDADGVIIRVFGMNQDITDRKLANKDAHDRLEQRIMERTAELSIVNSQLRGEIEERRQLEQRLFEARKLEAIGQLAGGVAHEVRNPLNAILSITEALFREREIVENREFDPYIEHIRTQVGRLARLMNDLLELGKPIPQSSLYPVLLYELCRETVLLWKSSGTAANKRVLLVAENEPLGMRVVVDRMKLQQVIFNLLENAGQHSRDQKILLSLDEDLREPAMAVIRVIDGGSGIAEDALTRIFDPFYSDRTGGTGLGLALVKHFIEYMGGTVSVCNNETSPGCTAELRIPMAKEEQAC